MVTNRSTWEDYKHLSKVQDEFIRFGKLTFQEQQIELSLIYPEDSSNHIILTDKRDRDEIERRLKLGLNCMICRENLYSINPNFDGNYE